MRSRAEPEKTLGASFIFVGNTGRLASRTREEHRPMSSRCVGIYSDCSILSCPIGCTTSVAMRLDCFVSRPPVRSALKRGSRCSGTGTRDADKHRTSNGVHMSEADRSVVRELAHFIDGRPVVGTSGRFGDVFDPSQGRVTARVPVATKDEAAAAVAAAKAAFPAWSETAPLKR